jgi:hypothetical protein
MLFSPFVDVLLWPTLDISKLNISTNSFTLAFITADGKGKPSWGSQISLCQNHFKDILEKIINPKITISFGGAMGTELACFAGNSIEMLVGYFQDVLETYPMVIGFDFDIEGDSLSNLVANDKRAKALVILQRMHPNLDISFTLPVMPTGLLQNALDLLSNARDFGLKLDHVNLMSMDYGIGCRDMSAAGIQAYESVSKQLQNISYPQDLVLTPMIGVNDTANEVFELKDAVVLRDYMKRVDGRGIKIWSLNRDVKDDGPLYKSSKIKQEDYEFCFIFTS